MGRILLICRLAARDLRRRPAEAALLVLAIMTATTTLTLGLVLHGVTSHPYQITRAATSGPDVVANVAPSPFNGGRPADLASLDALAHAPGVIGHGGPYPVVGVIVEAHGHASPVQIEGRDPTPAAIDQPKLTGGSWVRPGGVVVERSFADALKVRAGDSITLNGRTFQVRGVAVTAAMSPYPSPCAGPCLFGASSSHGVPDLTDAQRSRPHPGLIWLTRADARSFAARASLSYILNLKLVDGSKAPDFVNAHSSDSPTSPSLEAWQDISEEDGNLIRNEQRVLLTGSWLLVLLALANIAVLVGGRMVDQMRRVGLLKAVGATPLLITAVLLAEYIVLALLGATIGLVGGWLVAPLLARPSAGLLGSAGAVPLTMSTVELVMAVALGVAVVATFVPAIRAARTSTVLALTDSARAPRRTAWLIAISARLPVALLLGLRVAGRRPRRVVLCAISVAITVSGIVAVLAAHVQLNAHNAQAGAGSLGLADPRTDRLNQVLLLISVMLVTLAAVNVIVITWATVLDTKHASALARALGATPQQVSAGLSAAQVLPAVAGAILGIPGGIGLFTAVNASTTTNPPLTWLLATVLGTVLVMGGLTVIPARISARRPVAEILQSGLA